MKPAPLPLLLSVVLAAAPSASAQEESPVPAPSLTQPVTLPAPIPEAPPIRGSQETPAPQLDLPGPLRFAHPLGDAFLFRPAVCAPSCSLVVVSHSRGMTAELSLTRPHLRAVYARLLGAGYAVLVSNDAGPATWGAPQALIYLAEMRARAIQSFPFSGRTYNFGYSMGGLPALLTAYLPVYPVSGVVLLDAGVNLQAVWTGTNAAFQADIASAYSLPVGALLPPARDPYNDFATPEAARLPLLVAGSPDDRVVPFARHGEPLLARNTSPHSRLVRLTGTHLGGSHFGPAFLDEVLAFLNRLEHSAQVPPPAQPGEETR